MSIRAIALCGCWTGLAEEETQSVIIVEGGAQFSTADTVTRRTVMTQQIQGDAADQGQIFRRVIVARPTGIFPELDVQDQCC